MPNLNKYLLNQLTRSVKGKLQLGTLPLNENQKALIRMKNKKTQKIFVRIRMSINLIIWLSIENQEKFMQFQTNAQPELTPLI